MFRSELCALGQASVYMGYPVLARVGMTIVTDEGKAGLMEAFKLTQSHLRNCPIGSWVHIELKMLRQGREATFKFYNGTMDDEKAFKKTMAALMNTKPCLWR